MKPPNFKLAKHSSCIECAQIGIDTKLGYNKCNKYNLALPLETHICDDFEEKVEPPNFRTLRQNSCGNCVYLEDGCGKCIKIECTKYDFNLPMLGIYDYICDSHKNKWRKDETR